MKDYNDYCLRAGLGEELTFILPYICLTCYLYELELHLLKELKGTETNTLK